MKKIFQIIICFFVTILIAPSNVQSQMCPATAGANLVTNGNFESGCTGFTSEYTAQMVCGNVPIGIGNWTVTNSALSANSGDYFRNPTGPLPIGESAGNHYLVIDADGVANKDAWRSSVSVLAGTTYFFSAWISNINKTFENPPVLRFSINGVQIGTDLTASNNSHDWQQFFTTWTAPANATVDIRIENMITTYNGNDVAIDAISFSTSCANIPNLSSLGQASVLPDTVYNCNVDFPFNLNPGLPGSYDFKWKQVPGTTLSTATTYNVPPTPVNGTKYYLCYEYIAGCPRMDSVLFRVTPIAVNLGSDKVQCAPVNITLNSGISSAAATITWYRDNVAIPSATLPNYTATTTGTYRVDVTRPGCTAGSDELIITSPVSSISGTGTYCSSNNTSTFSVTGSTQVKWYTVASGGVALNVGDSNPTISPAHLSTNTTTPGCASGLYAEDISSYPGTLIPATSVATAPCGAADNYNNNSDLLIEVNQTMTLTSVDFFHNAGWGGPGTFTFSIFANSPTAGPHCGSCSPAGAKDGPTGGALYSTTSISYAAPGSGSVQRTLPASYTLTPGKYWFRLKANGTAAGVFNCAPAYAAGLHTWQSPYIDNTGNNAVRAIGAIKDNNYGSSGSLFNIQFQVGAANSCQRLFICATESCTSPVELIEFEVTKNNNDNYLMWVTGSETNSSHFIIERSVDGINFERIGIVSSVGNSSKINSYNYTDTNFPPTSGVIYYRLIQVDFNGDETYSNIKSIQSSYIYSIASIYPVPVKKGQNATVSIMGNVDETIKAEVFDNIGKLLFSELYNIKSGENTLELNIVNLSSGVYYLNLSGASFRSVKFVVE